MRYRPEIDGLRAVAVLPVVLFHAGFEQFAGGFVGVDIFFVISGFLITSILIGELRAGTFSLLHFYERRARRILPALTFIMALCVPFAWMWLMPHEMREFGRSLTAVALFGSNLLFWRESNYFDTAGEMKPLLHTWSLAVEEQYYILFPLFLMVAWRWGVKKLLTTLAVVSFFSLVGAHVLVGRDPSAAFYLLPTRAWEILLGAFGAFHMAARPNLARARWHELASGAGLALIIYSILFFDRQTPFPSFYALAPTVGALLLLLFARPGTVAHRLLAHRVPVGIGLISYSAYLWHQPLFAFARNVVSLDPSPVLMGALSLAALLLAYLTWRFIENPFRDRRRIERRNIFVFSGVAMAVFITAGVVVDANKGFAGRLELRAIYEGDVGHLDFHRHVAEKFYPCTPAHLAEEALRWEGFVRCMQSRNDRPVDLALVGDSHAEHLFLGLAEALRDKNVAFYIKASVPFIDNSEYTNIFKHVLSSSTIESVLLTMHWSGRLRQIPKGTRLEDHVLKTTAELVAAGKQVYLLDNVPKFAFNPDRCKFIARSARQSKCAAPKSDIEAYEALYSESLRQVVNAYPQVRLVPLRDLLCEGETCSMVKNGVLMYRDNNHLNILGSRYVGSWIAERYPELGHRGL